MTTSPTPSAAFAASGRSVPTWLRRTGAVASRADRRLNAQYSGPVVFMLVFVTRSWVVIATVGVLLVLLVGGSELHKRWSRPSSAAPAAGAAGPQVWPQGTTPLPVWPQKLMAGVISEKKAGDVSTVVMFVLLVPSLFGVFPALDAGWPLGAVLTMVGAGVLLSIAVMVAGPWLLVAASSRLAARRLAEHVGSLPARLNEDPRLRGAIEAYVAKAFPNRDAGVVLEIADTFDGSVDELIAATRTALDEP